MKKQFETNNYVRKQHAPQNSASCAFINDSFHFLFFANSFHNWKDLQSQTMVRHKLNRNAKQKQAN